MSNCNTNPTSGCGNNQDSTQIKITTNKLDPILVDLNAKVDGLSEALADCCSETGINLSLIKSKLSTILHNNSECCEEINSKLDISWQKLHNIAVNVVPCSSIITTTEEPVSGTTTTEEPETNTTTTTEPAENTTTTEEPISGTTTTEEPVLIANIHVENQSQLLTIGGDLAGVRVADSPGYGNPITVSGSPWPLGEYEEVTGTTDKIGTKWVYINVNGSSTPACVHITDSAGNHQFQEFGGISADFTFSGVVINSSVTVEIWVTDQACPEITTTTTTEEPPVTTTEEPIATTTTDNGCGDCLVYLNDAGEGIYEWIVSVGLPCVADQQYVFKVDWLYSPTGNAPYDSGTKNVTIEAGYDFGQIIDSSAPNSAQVVASCSINGVTPDGALYNDKGCCLENTTTEEPEITTTSSD